MVSLGTSTKHQYLLGFSPAGTCQLALQRAMWAPICGPSGPTVGLWWPRWPHCRPTVAQVGPSGAQVGLSGAKVGLSKAQVGMSHGQVGLSQAQVGPPRGKY